jgi:hypothetical protein
MTSGDFSAKFTRVCDARNDIYHHKSAARMTNVLSALRSFWTGSAAR